MAQTAAAQTDYHSNGGRLVATDGRELPLRGVTVRARASGGIARVILEQRFKNPYEEPLRVSYLLPLPSDGAVSGFAFTVCGVRTVGEVDRRAAARERFEQAIAEGRSAAIVEQDRSSLFTQEVGNVPPGEEVTCEITVDQKLAWLDEGAWEWRFPTVVAPRYLGEPGRVPDHARVTVDVAEQPLAVRAQLELSVHDPIAPSRKPESPSHPIAARSEIGGTTVTLVAEKGASLDRDLVVRWPVAAPKVGVQIERARPEPGRPSARAAYGLVTVVPPSPGTGAEQVARDLIVLLDASGSMSGEPIGQAKRVIGALIDTLGDQDRLEMIEFANTPRRWRGEAVRATAKGRAEAHKWLAGVQASGGTEMRSGILEALAPLRAESQRQIVLVTDGLIGSEDEVIEAIACKLPSGSRVHVVGVGSGVNRSLTQPAARAGRGVEAVIGLGEDPERAVERLIKRSASPLVVELEVSGSAVLECSPKRPPDLYAGAPALIALKLAPEGGEIVLRGRGARGEFVETLTVPATATGEGPQGVPALFAREAAEDLELDLAAGGERAEIDPRLERLGLDFQIATRLTSWVAVSEKPSVDPRDPSRKVRIPHELPYGMSIEGLGLRGAEAHEMSFAQSLGRARMSPAQGQQAFHASGYAPPAPPALPGPKGARPISAGKADESAARDEKKAGILDRVSNFLSPGKRKSPAPPEEVGEALKSEYQGEADDLTTESPPADHDLEEDPAAPVTPSPAPRRPEAKAKDKAGRALRGKIVLRKQGELILEIEIDGDLDWELPSEVTVIEDGGTWRAAVDEQRTTRAGALGAGRTLRLALRLPEAAGRSTIRRVLLETAGGPLTIEL